MPTLRKQFRDAVREARCNALAWQSFLQSSLVTKENVSWLFILTFPNGGSTAFAKLLLTASGTVALSSRAEGQWLIPSMSRAGTRWDKDLRLSKRKVRAVWLSRIRQDYMERILVIEKSPPNMCRYRALLNIFAGMQTFVVTFSRDPYATCASWHRRYGPNVIIRDWKPEAAHRVSNENDYFELLGDIWLERATMLFAARRDSIMDIRYEEFTENTRSVIGKLSAAIPHLRSVSASAKVLVKDYEAQGIVNMNETQIGLLSRHQIAAISNALRKNVDLVEGLGYSVLQQ